MKGSTMPAEQKKEPMIFRGAAASPGIAIGQVYIHQKFEPIISERHLKPDEVDLELARIDESLERSEKELNKILEFARKKLGDEQSKILETQVLLLNDDILIGTIKKRLKKEMRNAEVIITEEFGKYHKLIAASKDEFTRERAQDVKDVRDRIIRNLRSEKLISHIDKACIITSHNLTAADTLIFSRNVVLAYTSDIGGITSHTAILTRALKIPAVLGLHDLSTKIQPDDYIIVDGYSGTVIANPTPEQIAEYEKKLHYHQEFEAKLAPLAKLPAETLDGYKIRLHANVELIQEVDFVHEQGGDGIGLYRSETLLFGREVFPTEEEQYQVYRELADRMYPKPVVIRTFDIGGDKMAYSNIHENNPFLGWRGIRIMLDKEDLFLEQLRAILRASVRKNVSIMFPMITSIDEVRRAKAFTEKAKAQLCEKHLGFDDRIPIGIMIEVPAAAVIADDLAREVDFFSIGTNDLIQYLLAVDRNNELVANLFQEFHPSVVRFIRRIIERGSKSNVWIGMCGEMAGDPLATILLIGLGLQEFSVTPVALPEIKRIIRSVTRAEANEVAKKALEMSTASEIRTYLEKILRSKFPDIPLD